MHCDQFYLQKKQYFRSSSVDAQLITQLKHNCRLFRLSDKGITIALAPYSQLVQMYLSEVIDVSASNTFPYVKKRILVVQEEQYELTPVEVREYFIAYGFLIIVNVFSVAFK